MVNIQEKLNLLRFRVDQTAHISIDKNKCAVCRERPCLFFCPAGLFALSGEEVLHSYEGCLECGTCSLACEQKAVSWQYPRGGYGVFYRQS